MKCIEDEIPFELPEGWEWCRVRDIAAVKGGKRLPKGVGFSPCRTAHAYIRVTDMKNHCINRPPFFNTLACLLSLINNLKNVKF